MHTMGLAVEGYDAAIFKLLQGFHIGISLKEGPLENARIESGLRRHYGGATKKVVTLNPKT